MRLFAFGNLSLNRKVARELSSRFSFCAAWICVALFVVAMMASVGADAQMAGTGAISGTVTDSTGAVIGGATVTATLVSQNTSTTRTSTGAGDYTISPLTPGEYTLTVKAKGFQSYVQEHVTVDALVTVAVNVQLSVGGAEQTITVTTAPPVLETTDATLGAVMDNQMYTSLPLLMGAGGNADQRRATDFAALMPGVQTNYTNSNNATDASGAVNGGNPNGGTSEIYIDGVNLPEADGIGDPRFTWTAFGMDAIDQFQVQTTGFSAQYAGQGVQNYSIKQGGNQIHGSVYEYLRNTEFDAWSFFNKTPVTTAPPPPGSTCAYNTTSTTYTGSGGSTVTWCVPGGQKPAEHMNENGLTLGGPILKNKLFLFFNYGDYRYSQGPKPQIQTLPTYGMMGYTGANNALGTYADFHAFQTASTTAGGGGGGANYHIYDPSTQTYNCNGSSILCQRTQFTNDQIQMTQVSAAAKFFNSYMLPYEALVNQSQFSNNAVVGYAGGLSNWYQASRLDYNISSKHQLSVIAAFGRQASTGPNATGATNALGPPFNTSQSYAPQTTIGIIKETYTINSHMVNQLALAFGRYKSLSVTPDEQSQYATSNSGLIAANGTANGAALPPGQDQFFPGICFTGSTSCSSTGGGIDPPVKEAGYDGNQKVNNTVTASDNFQWQFGKHSLTFGGQVTEVQFNYIKNETYSSPLTYAFSSSQTGSFSSTSSTTINSSSGLAFASYMLGAVNSSSVSVGVPGLGSRWLDPSFWAQDDYRITPKLTVNAGLRWDIWPAIHEVHNLITWLNPTGANNITGNLGTLEFAGGNTSDGYHSGMPIPSSTWWKNVAPRLGFAYAVDAKTVIRSSYGLSFARGDWTSGSQSGSPSTTGLTPSATSASTPANAPQFYWDSTACASSAVPGYTSAANNIACGWTGSIASPAPSTGGASMAEFGTDYTVGLGSNGSPGMTYWDPYLGSRTPEYINWTFGVERQLTPDMSVTVSYVGSEGHFLSTSKAIGSRNNELPESMAALAGYTATGGPGSCSGTTCTAPLLSATSNATNLNQAINTDGFTPPNPYSAGASNYYGGNKVYQYFVPFPQFSGVSDTTSFVGNENWNALEITLRQRPAHGVNFMVNYTYSKSIDDLGTFRVGDNTRLDRSLSSADEPQNLTGTVVYALPVGRGHWMGDNQIYRQVFSDWSASSIVSYHSGFPILMIGTGCGGDAILNTCMPSTVPGNPGRINGAYGKHVTAASGSLNYIGALPYLNVAAFTVASNASNSFGDVNVGQGPAYFTPGNAARSAALNTWGMGYFDWDAALKRTFPIHENWNFAFEVDMSNVTNHTVFASPASTVGSSSFGEITSLSSANSPRDVQFSGRINF